MKRIATTIAATALAAATFFTACGGPGPNVQPGPHGPIGPQEQVGPQGPLGPQNAGPGEISISGPDISWNR